MTHREPISIKTTYTDSEGNTVEKTFRSLYAASKFFSISSQALKELSLGGNPKLRPETPKNLKVERIPTLPKTKTFPEGSSIVVGKWHCQICDKYIKPKSKYEHVVTMGHKKNQEKLINNNPDGNIVGLVSLSTNPSTQLTHLATKLPNN